MSGLSLQIRTPAGLMFGRPVLALTAEDQTGWFGVRPGRADVVAVLPPGLLVYRDDEGEGFVAHSGGLLSVVAGACKVLVTEATASRDLDAIAHEVARQERRRSDRAEVHQGVVRDLAREALRRLLGARS